MDRVFKVINFLLLGIVGMLLLACVMVLVQGSKVELGKVADWATVLSAVATLGIYVVTWLVYLKVPDWLAPKLKTKQFEFADELIEEFCALQHDFLTLFSKFLVYVNTSHTNNNYFNNVTRQIGDDLNIYIRKIIHLRAKMGRMELWGLKPKNSQVFNDLINSHQEFFDSLLETHASKSNNPLNDYLTSSDIFLNIHQKMSDHHRLIIKPYDELFEK